jgi:hypothetical protein
MNTRLIICLVLSILIISFASAQVDIKAANRNTWNLSGLINSHYQLPIDEGDYTEEGNFVLDLDTRGLWFPTDGLGIGVDASLDYSTSFFTSYGFGIGPRVAYYFKPPFAWGLMPYAGTSFQYLREDIELGRESNGWGLEFGIGISPLIGTHVTLPVEFGFATQQVTSVNSKNEEYTTKSSRMYLEFGLGVFLW